MYKVIGVPPNSVTCLRKSYKGVQRVNLDTATQKELKILHELGHKFVIIIDKPKNKKDA